MLVHGKDAQMGWMCVILALFLAAGCVGRQAAPSDDESPYFPLSSLQKGQILHLATGRLFTPEELVRYLSGFPIVYVGETHDSLDDHAVELAILKGLVEAKPGSVAVGLEMLQRPFQPDVDAFLRGDLDEKAFIEVWQKNWGDTYPYYREILDFAREKAVPVRALNVGSELREVARRQTGSSEGTEKESGLPEMDLEDPYHRAYVQAILSGHPMGVGHFDAFYRVQVLWDEAMAETAAAYLRSPEGSGKQMLILAGGNHVRYGLGIPRRLFRRLPLPFAIVLPLPVEIPEEKRSQLMDVEIPPIPLPPADFYWAVGYESLSYP